MIIFFKQRTAYEMRISDWSSDVCSSDLESPHAYLSRLRMGLAAQLLRNPSTLIATVADKVGFGSDVAFYRAFRRHFGQSPGAFRLAQSGVPGLHGARSEVCRVGIECVSTCRSRWSPYP